MTKTKKTMAGAQLLRIIADAAEAKKADDVSILNLSRESGIADWFIICQGDNAPHNRAIADNIVGELEKLGTRPFHTEGTTGVNADGRWIVMDFSDVIVHVMTPQVRKYYNLEELWTPIDIKEIEKRAHE